MGSTPGSLDRAAATGGAEAPATRRAPRSVLRRLALLPEANMWFFAFLVNYPWEFLQTPWFRHMPDLRHWEAVKLCSWAAVGDGVLAVVAYWLVAAFAVDSRSWILRPRPRTVAGFVLAAEAITVTAEWVATEVLDRWSYAPDMPTLPLLGTGAAPLLQWLLLPPLIVAIVRRQLGGGRRLAPAERT